MIESLRTCAECSGTDEQATIIRYHIAVGNKTVDLHHSCVAYFLAFNTTRYFSRSDALDTKGSIAVNRIVPRKRVSDATL